MSQSFLVQPSDAPVDATYLTQVADARGILTANQVLGSLATGYRKNTTGSGVQTVQAVPLPIADGATLNTTVTTNGVAYKDATKITYTAAGANNTILHGNTGSAPTYSGISLTADVSGVLPIANGGTNQSSALTAGSIIFQGASGFAQDNANFFWDDTLNQIILGGAADIDTILGADGSVIANEKGTDGISTRIEGDTATNLVNINTTANTVHFGTTVAGDLAKFAPTEITFNESGSATKDFRVEGDTQPNLLFVDASADQIGIRTNAPHSTLDVVGGLSLNYVTKTATYTATANDFAIGFTTLSVGTTNLNLPDASTAGAGVQYFVKRIAATDGARVLVVNPSTGDTIDGVPVAGVALAAQWSGVWLISDGGINWQIIK